ncbi:hypothetical protein C0991_008758 [Blastosporella zonata]|nr:hypothetical protein C0991_008758 [Blastosporella zonata]
MPSNNHGQTEAGSGTVTPLASLLYVSKTVLLQAVDLLDDYLTSDDQLTVSSKFLPGSTIGLFLTLATFPLLIQIGSGKHLRHARDHFVLLMDSVSSSPPHVLSYDTRCRNTPMEGSRSAARAALMEAIEQLETQVPLTQMDLPLTLHAVTPDLQEFQTTFGRELWFAGLHCVHHWSMVRVIAGELVRTLRTALNVTLKNNQNIQLTEDFGFAPSTLVYQGNHKRGLRM